ncbi:MAG: CoB--CoM heterodisulfide reductase iron-sulfur subunit A family protein, partial [Ruminiclostridium sp.]|nr:CoB--CoM heterodisulfide reductase iron-sulfur subunit A family protein [Ruminiclostridium sp.]
MNHHILVIGGGLAGCTAALELANGGKEVTILEKSGRIGGKVRNYGCKATDRCNNCGLCLVKDLWNQVERHKNINIVTDTRLTDVQGSKGNFSIGWKKGRNVGMLDSIEDIIVSTGFEESSSVYTGSLELTAEAGIVSGRQMEELFLKRTDNRVFAESPKSIAFIQCFGSRDVHEKAAYCSRVCCGYSTRMARVLRKIYPEAEIVFFYMDIQRVEAGEYFNCLNNEGIEFIRCRPVKIKPGKPNRIQYDQPGAGSVFEKEFDIIILSEGIHPAKDTELLAELCMLKVGGNGFLKYVKDGEPRGIYLAGCVSGPEKIEEVHSESLAVARGILKQAVMSTENVASRFSENSGRNG